MEDGIAIDKTQKAITWEQFQNVLLQSRLVIRDQKKTSEDTKKYCRICEEGHLTEEHNDQCPNCEGNHPAEECPTINVTCFLCEETDHYPVHCKIFLEVQRKVQQSKERKQVTPEEASQDTTISWKVVDEERYHGEPDSLLRSCHSCGKEGYKSNSCSKKDKKKEYAHEVESVEIEYDPQEIAAILAKENPKVNKIKTKKRKEP